MDKEPKYSERTTGSRNVKRRLFLVETLSPIEEPGQPSRKALLHVLRDDPWAPKAPAA
ncbi:MAG TPA: hypothetical protein VFB25_05470 [Gaiellaceae bacterium]|nr:hypothetical protein [Gaiellaceae bacterium]